LAARVAQKAARQGLSLRLQVLLDDAHAAS
jgi:hypothetical protein